LKRRTIYYEHSGTLTKRGIILAVAAGIVVALIIGLLGGAMMLVGFYYIDIGFLGIVATAGLGGVLMGEVIKLGKIRNERFAYWGGLFIGFLALLITCFFTYVFLQMGDVESTTGLPNGVYFPWEDPERMFSIVHAYVMDDTKTASAILPGLLLAVLTRLFFFAFEFPHFSGFWLYALWVLEALILVFWAGSVSKTTAGQADFVFCEACSREAQVLYKSPLLNALPMKDQAGLQKLRLELEKGVFETFETLPVAKEKIQAEDYSQLILRGCDHCHDLYCADLVNVAVKWDGYDLEQNANNNLRVVEHLMLPRVWYTRLRDYFETCEYPVQPIDADAPVGGGKLVFVLVGAAVLLALSAAVLYP
jgi:hypothetical protein